MIGAHVSEDDLNSIFLSRVRKNKKEAKRTKDDNEQWLDILEIDLMV